ncbi:MAG: methyltransferase domain-containing protein [Armatimonadetes bacterium]|nr:methyltransferase domain-containing protein [Armatimonadota bacterium]
MAGAFDRIAAEYDRWYDEPEGRAIFAAELECLRSLAGQVEGDWLEVGIGTGRFSHSLGIRKGVDPSPQMLGIAAERGIEVLEGAAEDLPFSSDSFDGILMALTLCFVADAQRALQECERVLRPGGRLLLGVVPADSPWGRDYSRKAAHNHPIYSTAHFRTMAEITELADKAGFIPVDARSTLFWAPGKTPELVPRIEAGVVSEAGFVGLLFEEK